MDHNKSAHHVSSSVIMFRTSHHNVWKLTTYPWFPLLSALDCKNSILQCHPLLWYCIYMTMGEYSHVLSSHPVVIFTWVFPICQEVQVSQMLGDKNVVHVRNYSQKYESCLQNWEHREGGAETLELFTATFLNIAVLKITDLGDFILNNFFL